MRVVAVGEVLNLVREQVEVVPDATYVNVGVRSFGKGVFHYPPCRGDELSKLRFYKVEPGRLFLSNIKAWEGAIAVTGDDDEGCVASNRFLPYAGSPHEVDVRYLLYFFLSDVGLPLIQRASPGSADRNRTLGIKRFEALEIPLPDIAEQKRIADAASAAALAVKEVRRLRKEQERRLEALTLSVFHDMFDRLR